MARTLLHNISPNVQHTRYKTHHTDLCVLCTVRLEAVQEAGLDLREQCCHAISTSGEEDIDTRSGAGAGAGAVNVSEHEDQSKRIPCVRPKGHLELAGKLNLNLETGSEWCAGVVLEHTALIASLILPTRPLRSSSASSCEGMAAAKQVRDDNDIAKTLSCLKRRGWSRTECRGQYTVHSSQAQASKLPLTRP